MTHVLIYFLGLSIQVLLLCIVLEFCAVLSLVIKNKV